MESIVDKLLCGDCKSPLEDEALYTEVNPAGGYDQPQLLVCDDCMRSGRWDHWIAEHWPTWPGEQSNGRGSPDA